VSNISKRGVKSQYNKQYHPKLIKWLCRAGATDEEIAKELEISARQLYRWYKKYPELCQSKKEKIIADMEVEDSLLKRALGYDVEETQVIATKDGKSAKVRKNKRHIPADITACIFWLKNRQPKRWRKEGGGPLE
jgi:transposase-like protein